MEKTYLDALGEVKYTELSKEEEEKLREYENKFNNEFNKKCYFMVMER